MGGTLTADNHLTDSACAGDHCHESSNACPGLCGHHRDFTLMIHFNIEVDSVRKGSVEWTVRTLNCF